MQTERPERAVDHAEDRRLAAMVLVMYGIVILLAEMAGVRGERGIASAPFWPLAHLAVVAVLAAGIVRGRPWAWWGSLVLAGIGLFLLAPIGIAMLAGSGGALTALVPTVHLILVSLEGVFLLLLVLLLARMGWRRKRA